MKTLGKETLRRSPTRERPGEGKGGLSQKKKGQRMRPKTQMEEVTPTEQGVCDKAARIKSIT